MSKWTINHMMPWHQRGQGMRRGPSDGVAALGEELLELVDLKEVGDDLLRIFSCDSLSFTATLPHGRRYQRL
jgi:hypothetical protein